MLAEFALTPSIFDEQSHGDPDLWREQIRELGSSFFPRGSVSPVIVSNLYEGSWHHASEDLVKTIQDHRARKLCQDLLTRLRTALVFRPSTGDWPNDDCDWAREAIASAGEEPIERIVATDKTRSTLAAEGLSIRCVSEIDDAGFWHGIASVGTVKMEIADQVSLLRKLCVHSEFLCILTPHIYGGADDELDFAIELIRSALNRPHGFRPVSIDIHTEAPKGTPGEGDFDTRLANVVHGITNRLKPVLGKGKSLNLYMWPKLLHRYVIGGVFSAIGRERTQRSPRWGVTIHHFARRGDNSSLPPAPWNLLRRDDLSQCFSQYFREDSKGYLCVKKVQG